MSRLIDADDLPISYIDITDVGYYVSKYGQGIPVVYLEDIKDAPTIEPEQRWIPCSERLPEENVNVLITYRYKEGEGDTSHAYIGITTYGQMYFGGNKVENHKHWRQPFEYFTINYEVVAWKPLPEPYRGKNND